MAKVNPFLVKKKPKENPFLKKVAKQPKAEPVDQLAKARAAKAQKKLDEEAAKVAAIPEEIKRLEKSITELEKKYDKARDEATAAFKKLDKLKDRDSDRFRKLKVEWDDAEKRTLRNMAALQGAYAQLKLKRKLAADRAA